MKSSIPYITIADKNNLNIIEGKKPALIVEGKSDYRVYSRILTLSQYAKKFDIVVGDCKKNILRYYNDKEIKFDHVILLDADYDHLNNNCINDEKILYTRYYTMENYITMKDIVNKTLEDFMTIQTSADLSGDIVLKEVIDRLTPYIVVCLMKLHNNWNIAIEDCSIDRWLMNNKLASSSIFK